MRLQVYKEPFCRRHYAAPCSCAALFYLGVLVTLLLAPFYMAYNPYTFWEKTSTYLEQPKIAYTYQVMVLLEGTTGGSKAAPFQAFFTSMAQVNSLYQAALRVPLIQSRSVDMNSDGLPDRVTLNVQMPMAAAEKVYSFKALVFFQTQLQDRAKLGMDTVAYAEATTGLPARAVALDGDFLLRQTWPLAVGGGYQEPYADDPLLTPSATVSSEQALFSKVLDSYAARNVTMDFTNRYVLWEAGQAPTGGARVAAAGSATGIFNATMTIRIDQQNVLYTPPVSEVLQAGWIQYLAMFVVVWFVLDRFAGYVYFNQIVETRVVQPQAVGGFGASSSSKLQ